jgi:peroxiredoxin
MIAIGQAIPELEIMLATKDGPAKLQSTSLFEGKKVVLFGLPGAFTPTCSMNHLPGFIENRQALSDKGVDAVICVTVNDHHVVKAWAKQANALESIKFVADFDAKLTKALGLEIDLSAGGLGLRSKRYSMIIDDGKVSTLNVEDSPGVAEISGAATILGQL